ncbi:hypothetical protein [Parvimonas micra]|uniref:hypothetical protein n=1 Tax=Parvimonas micra TaxID=33033 RepID=UPI0022B6E639|nr:hypothetical protein [Parvimonas micra]WBB29958.1 hypothetical protein NM223_02795 [Parvimonas micra]
MSRNLKKKIYKMNLILVCSAVLLASCSKKQEEKEKTSTKKFEFVEKETNYKKDETTEVLIDAEIKKSDIVRSYKHGDHWHVFTKDGKEHITYTDPSKLGDGNSLSLVSVVSRNKLRGLNVRSILKHGDHWHVYTADGREYLTYEDPSSMFPNITVGTYVGSHNSHRNRRNSNNYSHANIIEEKKDRVVKILRHGDHWHIYTASGKEYISYTDPTSKYPDAEVGEYQGNHGDSQNNTENEKPSEKPNVPSASEKLYEARKNLNIVNVLGKNPIDRYDIVKILKHGDHYHIYDSKGNEGITYTDPRSLYPNAEFGEYKGNHGDENKKPFEWPKGVTKIVDHGDHWHLYIGDKEVGVVHENPRSHYPDAEYIKEGSDHSDIGVDEKELFTYESVKAEIKDKVIPYLDSNLRAMRHYGDLDTTLPVYGSNGVKKGIFYWLHGGHYHAITIKQIIQNAKAGQYGECTAREIVAALKYIIQNPDKEIESKVTVDREEVVKYLMKVYNLKDRMDVNIIGDIAYVYINDETLTFSLADFEKVNGEIRYKKKLPEVPKKADSNEKKSEEKEDTTELPKQNEENKKLPSIEKSEKDDKKISPKSEDKKVDEKKNTEKSNTDKPIKSEEKNEEKENKNN